MNYIIMDSPIGALTLVSEDDKLSAVLFGEKECGSQELCEALKITASQLKEYFSGSRRIFSLPIGLNGTQFRQRVWRSLLDIPYGKTSTYGKIAAVIGSPKGSRAVGYASRSNPIPIIIPCHRVVGYDGSLTGYAGGLEKKQFLLELESRNAQ